MVFTYDGFSRFSVTVFGSLGVVDPPALVAKRTNNVVIKIEDDEEEVHVDMDAGDTPETSILPPEEGNGITGKRTREVNDVIADGNASKRHSSVPKQAEKKRPEAIAGTSKGASTIVNTEKGKRNLMLKKLYTNHDLNTFLLRCNLNNVNIAIILVVFY